MDRKSIGWLLLLLASSGCHACNSCCDYLPPVPDGPYPYPGGRAGSVLGMAADAKPDREAEIINPALHALPVVEAP